jgi:isocitrate dehydrogenase (NAD+)
MGERKTVTLIPGDGIGPEVTIILSGVLMLRHIGENTAAEKIAGAVREALRRREKLTPDLGGDGTTTELTERIVAHL